MDLFLIANFVKIGKYPSLLTYTVTKPLSLSILAGSWLGMAEPQIYAAAEAVEL
jgi:hypothetical protein